MDSDDVFFWNVGPENAWLVGQWHRCGDMNMIRKGGLVDRSWGVFFSKGGLNKKTWMVPDQIIATENTTFHPKMVVKSKGNRTPYFKET